MNKTALVRWLAALAVSLAFLLPAPAGEPGGEVLTNADIVQMLRAKVSDATVVAKIGSTPNRFDLSAPALVVLQTNGVPDTVINAMMTASRSAPAQAIDRNRFRAELNNVATGSPIARRDAIAWFLSHREPALPLLRQALNDSSPGMRAGAVMVLGQQRDSASLPAIRTLITDSSPDVRRTAAQVLAEMNDPQAISSAETALAQRISPLDGFIRLIGHVKLTRAAGALGQILATNAEPSARGAAAWSLGEIGRPGLDGRPALEKALVSDSDPMVRREAAAALANFHDSRTAQLLEETCRKDYEVRKVTLTALAEYPEAVGFLVDVMNLGNDQIAADELETARSSLVRLTGQDFNLDGGKWAEWFDANRSRYPSYGGAPAMARAESSAMAAGSPVTGIRQLDLEKWSILADASDIPMAPQVDSRSPARPGLPLGGPGYSPIPDPAGLALVPSPRDFDAVTPDLTTVLQGAGAAAPSSIPPLDFSRGSVGDSSDELFSGPKFQSWSSDPERAKTPEPAPSSSPARTGGLSPSGTEDFSDLFDQDEPMAGSYGPLRPTGPAPSSLPAEVVPRQAPERMGGDELRGIALTLPGMENMPATPPAAVSPEPALGMDGASMTLAPPAPTPDTTAKTFEAPASFLMESDGPDTSSSASLSPFESQVGHSDQSDGVIYGDIPDSLGFAVEEERPGVADPFPSPLAGPSAGGDDVIRGGYADPFAGIDDQPTTMALPTPVLPSAPADASPFRPAGEPMATESTPVLWVDDGMPSAPASSFNAATGDSAPILLVGVGQEAAPIEKPVTEKADQATSPSMSVPASSVVVGEDAVPEPALPIADDLFPVPSEGGMTSIQVVSDTAGSTDAVISYSVPVFEETPTGTTDSIFVEPAPGQHVVGEMLIPTGPITDAPAPAVVYPVTPAPVGGQQPYVVTTPTPAPAPIPVPAPEPIRDTRSAAEIYFEATKHGETAIPKELYPAESLRPAPAQTSGEWTTETAPSSTTTDYFRDPSAPRPPVRPEGTVTAPKGKDQPPMLGEGLFK